MIEIWCPVYPYKVGDTVQTIDREKRTRGTGTITKINNDNVEIDIIDECSVEFKPYRESTQV